LLGIPHYCLNFREFFAEKVIDDFVDQYRRGRTPNPCVNCNRYVKFDALLAKARQLGADYLATGHYARVGYHEDRGRWTLSRAVAVEKDQTYALYHFTQEQLSRTLMPLGELASKRETRAIAGRLGFAVADKPDSQEICFVQGGSYTDVLASRAPETVHPGNIVDTQGRVRGRHQGVAFYTIGQRKRINVGSPTPLFVIDLDTASQTVTVGNESDLQARSLLARDCNWVSISGVEDALRVTAKIRYNMIAQPASLVKSGEDEILVEFEESQRAITPGQAVVMYDGDTVVGGATIERKIDEESLSVHKELIGRGS
jgi:tRNA-specific 2-thiouridylase